MKLRIIGPILSILSMTAIAGFWWGVIEHKNNVLLRIELENFTSLAAKYNAENSAQRDEIYFLVDADRMPESGHDNNGRRVKPYRVKSENCAFFISEFNKKMSKIINKPR